MPYQDVVSLARKYPNIVYWGDAPKVDAMTGEGSVTYAKTVRLLLEKHFGAASSLTIDAAPRRSGQSTLYFLSLDDAEKEKIRSLRDTFNALPTATKASFPELIQPYAPRPRSERQVIRVAKFQMNRDEWRILFYPITGYRFHRSHGRKIAASVTLSKHPYITLSSSAAPEVAYGLWASPQNKNAPLYPKGEGILFSVNKNLFESRRFRGFVADFLMAIGTAEGKHIIKDISRSIAEVGCVLPQISFPDLLACHTPKDILALADLLPKRNVLCRNLNAMDINCAYVAARLLPQINSQDVPALSHITPEDVRRVIASNPSILYQGMGTGDGPVMYMESFISSLFQRGPFDFPPNAAQNMARDYLRLCDNLLMPVNYWPNDPEKYLRAHNQMAEIELEQIDQMRMAEENEPLITVPSLFDRLETALTNLNDGFERIYSSERLAEEGRQQHNCVYSRRHLLRADKAAIYHWKSYTVQFGTKDGCYCLDEVRDKYNKTCMPEDLQQLRDILHKVNNTAGA